MMLDLQIFMFPYLVKYRWLTLGYQSVQVAKNWQEDFTALDHIFRKTAEENNQTTQNDEDDQILSMHGTNVNNSGSQCNDYNNSYDEIVFDRMSQQSQETEWTKEDITSKRWLA